MDTKVQQNPKYAHIKSTVKSGKTIKDVEILSDKVIAKKRKEVFRRIKGSTLAKLLSEQSFAQESVYSLGDSPAKEETPSPAADTESVYSYQSATSAVSAVTYATEQLGITVIKTIL